MINSKATNFTNYIYLCRGYYLMCCLGYNKFCKFIFINTNLREKEKIWQKKLILEILLKL
ncbi:hypothetical protein [Fusobacterium phage Fnu1]|uniref:Uncharacterized protein n=1 Tax=Fusobacterium phage Fnu1 TaxID=2530024 RepID=A0A481W5T5_9CAUD|nr:hypothetical protein KMD24_gp173 [Fusobacterium phage Fnu1]QBJ04229.1 hypothetical protein [Fusobacterium phage Fnu1]